MVQKKRTSDSDKKSHRESLINQLEHTLSESEKDLDAAMTELKQDNAGHEDVSEALSLSMERMKRLSKRTLDVLEADRQTISKELHDSIGASLAAIKFSLEEKELVRKENKGRLDEPLDQEIAYLLKTIKETKRISAHLRPTTLDDLGLMATIEWYLRQFKQMYGNIRVDYSTEINERDVPEDMKIIIYRIVQEGLTNAEKHGKASVVGVNLSFSNDNHSIFLKIEDNGRGFDVADVLSNKDPLSGYGLIAMQERCEIYGGTFHIQSQRNRGTIITAMLPV